MAKAKRVDVRRRRVAVRGVAKATPRDGSGLVRALDVALREGRSFKCVIVGDRAEFEIGPTLTRKLALELLEAMSKRHRVGR